MPNYDIAALTARCDEIYHSDDFDFDALTAEIAQTPAHSTDRINLALRYEICPIHLCDEQICADDDDSTCAAERA